MRIAWLYGSRPQEVEGNQIQFTLANCQTTWPGAKFTLGLELLVVWNQTSKNTWSKEPSWQHSLLSTLRNWDLSQDLRCHEQHQVRKRSCWHSNSLYSNFPVVIRVTDLSPFHICSPFLSSERDIMKALLLWTVSNWSAHKKIAPVVATSN